MNLSIIVSRFSHHSRQTLGNGSLVMHDPSDPDWENQCETIFEFVTLELPWKKNTPNKSCIPLGIRPLVKEWSPAFKAYLYEIYQVPGRSECKLHRANYVSQLNGCIAPGVKHVDLNNDGLLDVSNSKQTLKIIHDLIKKNAQSERESMFLTIQTRNVENGFSYL